MDQSEVPVYLRTPRPVSNSEVGVFKDCRRRWYLGQFRGLHPKREGPTGAAHLGDRVHKWLAQFYDPLVTAVTTAAHVLDGWNAETLALIEEWPGNLDVVKESELGFLMLEGYFQWLEETGADSDLEVIDAERNVSVPVPNYVGPRPIALVGKTDVKVRRRSTGARLFIDHKTVASINDLPKRADIMEQFKHYAMLDLLVHVAQGESPDATFVDGGVYNMLRKVKRTKTATPPFYGRHDVRYTRDQLRTYWTRLLGEVAEMQRVEDALLAGVDHQAIAYPTPSRDCDWKCEFRAVCPMLDDPTARAEDFLAEVYETGDPYARYQPRTESV